MLLFLDTEFTDFIDTEILAIGLVSDNNKHEFYAERTDFSLKACSDFVKEEVLPLFDKSGFVGTKDQIGDKLAEWLRNLPAGELVIVVDYIVDWQLFAELLNGRVPMKLKRSPEMIQTITDFATDVSIKGVEDYFEVVDKRRHHALVDAKANRNGWLQAMKTLY
jgi:hypothetical protein